ncbi:hypothetical protein OW763_10850 [Clostridium aestuarii]|uniref:RsgI N-terminal anti-sigma domain-containing protein n=1 Tax=Clostridium aestuarii TaxID=338193 RepID=A0ABT4D0T1_9CLOT|nr:hypothetical protein [Clostridium aestuarii]MCY6484839.1 hypothetical protein [Clostridium aestuarii]
MKKKTGVVVKVEKNYICIRSVHGQFINLKIKNYTPNIGDIYTGTPYKPKSVTIARVVFILFLIGLIVLGRNIYYYFVPSATIIIKISPTVQIKTNKWDKIISVNGVKRSGKALLENIKIKNKNINEGLELIINEAKSKKIIDEKYIKNKNIITIYISSDNNKFVDLSSFEKFTHNSKLKYQINNNGVATFVK